MLTAWVWVDSVRHKCLLKLFIYFHSLEQKYLCEHWFGLTCTLASWSWRSPSVTIIPLRFFASVLELGSPARGRVGWVPCIYYRQNLPILWNYLKSPYARGGGAPWTNFRPLDNNCHCLNAFQYIALPRRKTCFFTLKHTSSPPPNLGAISPPEIPCLATGL